MSLHILIATVGSAGDVLPFVLLGKTLAGRGHEVTFITNEHFRADAARNGLTDFVPMGTEEDFQRATSNPDLWHPRKAFGVVADFGIVPTVRPMLDALRERIEPGRTVVVASSLAMAARVLQDATGVPTVSVHLQPSVIRSQHRILRIPGWFQPAWLPRFMRPAMWRLIDRMIDSHVAPAINELRGELGLPPVSAILGPWLSSPLLTIGLFAEWFHPRLPDWPDTVRVTGFPLADGDSGEAIDPALEQFLAAGDAPVVCTPGSAMVHGREFFAGAIAACQALGRRAVLLTRAADQLPAELPPGMHHATWVPFSRILPRAAAFVHHGGVGSMSQAMAAGVPQVFMPMAHDQYDNAFLAGPRGLGVCTSVPEPRWTARRVTRALRRVLQPDVQARCREVAARFVGQNAVADTCDLIEQAASGVTPATQLP